MLLSMVTPTFSPHSGVFHYPLQSGVPGESIAGGLDTQAGAVCSRPSRLGFLVLWASGQALVVHRLLRFSAGSRDTEC